MKNLRKLAIICAKRNDVLLSVINGYVKISVRIESDMEDMSSDWKNNKTMKNMIHELNYGKYKIDVSSRKKPRNIGLQFLNFLQTFFIKNRSGSAKKLNAHK
jgi:hypothetical protein